MSMALSTPGLPGFPGIFRPVLRASGFPDRRRRRGAARAGAVLLAVLLLLTLPACDSSNPVAPAPPEIPPPGGSGGGSWSIQLSLVPSSLQAGNSGTLSVKVARASDQSPPESGTTVDLNSNDLGFFGLDGGGNPLRNTSVTLTGGAGQTPYFAGDEIGKAEVLALFGDSTASLNLDVTERTLPPFFVSSVSPDVGSGAGGTQVTLAGQGFEEPLRVTFGDANAQVVKGSITGTRIQVVAPPTVPALAAGETRRVDVTVTIDLDQETPRSDTLAGGFLYSQGGGPFNQPAIFSVSPTRGANEGGTEVVIRGQGFENDARVFFGFEQGSGFQGVQTRPNDTVVSPDGSEITVRTPPATGAGSFLLNQIVDVKVENPRSGLFAVANAVFQYGGEGGGSLLVTAIDPPRAPYTARAITGGPLTIRLRGQGFGSPGDEDDLRVTLAGVTQGNQSGAPEARLTVVSDQVLDVVLAPAAVSGCAPVSGPASITQVVTGDSTISDAIFTYTVPTLRVSGLSPGSSPEAGGPVVAIQGSGFLGTGANPGDETVEVTFDGVRGTVQSVSADEVTVAAPAFTGTFPTEDCDENGDGVTGTRNVAVPVDVVLTNRTNGCGDALARAFTYQPSDDTCIEPAPGAELEASFTFVVSDLKVTFKNTSSGNPTEFFWDFGDGTTGIETTQEDPIHTYGAANTYNVTLTVQDADGKSDSVTRPVTVTDP